MDYSAVTFDLAPFVDWMRSWGAAPTTIASRRQVLAAGIREWGSPHHVTTEALGRWLGADRFAGWTRVSYYGHLRSLFEWMRKAGLREDDPTRDLRRPIPPRDKPRPLTHAEVALIRRTATGNQRTWFELGVRAGLRAHEIAKIRGEHVDPDTIYVLGKGGQGAFVPTHPELWAVAQSYPRKGWWFPSPTAKAGHVSPKSVSTLTTRLFSSLGIEGSSHRARHTYATHLLRNGESIRVVQELMRHSSLATTAKYTAVDEDERRAAINRLVA
jgi:integrase/recombinase XerD